MATDNFVAGQFPAGTIEGGMRLPAMNSGQHLRTSHLANSGYQARGSELHEFVTDIPAASVLTLRATPYQLVGAPGAGYSWKLIGGVLVLQFVSVAYTESTANLQIRYTNSSGANASTAIEMTGFIDQSASKRIGVIPILDTIIAPNAALVLFNLGAGEFANSGDGILHFHGIYQLVPDGF